MSSALPSASVAAVDVASGATVAANNDDANGAVVPPSSTEDKGASSAGRWSSKSLGDDKANLLIDRILQGSDVTGIEGLKWMDPQTVSELLLGDLAQCAQTEHREAAGIGEHRPVPSHEAV